MDAEDLFLSGLAFSGILVTLWIVGEVQAGINTAENAIDSVQNVVTGAASAVSQTAVPLASAAASASILAGLPFLIAL